MSKKIYLIAAHLFAVVIFMGVTTEKASATNTTCPSPLNPATNVFIYSDRDFSGSCWYFGVPSSGSAGYDLTQIAGPSSQNNWNDAISSIHVPSGYTATLYADVSGGNGSGTEVTFSSDQSYVGNAYNDWASFIKITKTDAGGGSGGDGGGTGGGTGGSSAPSSAPTTGIVQCGPGYYDASGNEIKCDKDQFYALISRLFKFLVFISGVIVVLAIAVGGFFMLISAGSEERLSYGKSTMKAAIIGFIVVLLGWIIVNTIITSFTNCHGAWYRFEEFSCSQ